MECYFCKQNIKEIDFQNVEMLKHYISGLGKIRAKKRTGVCAKHQRQVAKAIKRARHLGLLSACSK
ncbi:MAG: 30S ribosomal protein S18 [Candidatus Pacebacteria bacterium]|nr:30S ribosomal protein S18 [Candidatus Paceibacterota bacterium]